MSDLAIVYQIDRHTLQYMCAADREGRQRQATSLHNEVRMSPAQERLRLTEEDEQRMDDKPRHWV